MTPFEQWANARYHGVIMDGPILTDIRRAWDAATARAALIARGHANSYSHDDDPDAVARRIARDIEGRTPAPPNSGPPA